MIVVRIKHFYDSRREILLLYRLLILTPVEIVQAKLRDGLRVPDTEGIYEAVSVTDHRHVVRHRPHRFEILVNIVIPLLLFVPLDAYRAAEPYHLGKLLAPHLERIAVLKPVVRLLDLISVLYFLPEHPVFVADTAAVRGVAERRKRVQKTRREASQPTVSQSRVGFLILHCVQIDTHFVQSFPRLFVSREIYQAVPQGPSHEKFHRHIINGLRILLSVFVSGLKPVIYDNILHGVGNTLETLPRGRLLNGSSEKPLGGVSHVLLKFVPVKSVFDRTFSHLQLLRACSRFFALLSSSFALFRFFHAFFAFLILLHVSSLFTLPRASSRRGSPARRLCSTPSRNPRECPPSRKAPAPRVRSHPRFS